MTKRTTTESELRFWLAEGKTHAEIAKVLGRSQSAVAAAFAVLGINGKGRRNNGAPPIAAYLAGLRAGMTIREIAAAHDVSHPAVVQALKRSGNPTCARKLLRAEAEKQTQPA